MKQLRIEALLSNGEIYLRPDILVQKLQSNILHFQQLVLGKYYLI